VLSEMSGKFFIMAILLAALAPAVRAAERVTLRNGFEMRCDHSAPVEGRVRLYLGTDEDNYIEFKPQEVASMERVPDPPATSASEPQAAGISANSSAGSNTRLNTADLNEMLTKAGKEHNVDVDLLASLVKAESDGNAHAVSPAGARGLMQLMPSTASELGVQDSFKADENVRGGSTYLDAMLIRYRDNLALALAAYNAGPQAVDKYHGIPPYHETRAYVARVIHEFNRRVLAREAQARQAVASTSYEKDNQQRPSRISR
jgi:soluble lytic murein transglycosylase-like protein